MGDLMPAELLPAAPQPVPVPVPVEAKKPVSKDVVKRPETKKAPRIKAVPTDVVKEVKPQPKEKSREELARDRLLKRVESLRARALERKIEFPQVLEEDLRKQTTKGAVCRVWKAYLQSQTST
jgi:hypothetical protein